MKSEPIKSPSILVSTLVVLAGIALGFLFDNFVVKHTPGISFPLFIIVLLTVVFSLSKITNRPFKTSTWLIIIPVLLLAIMVFLRGNFLLQLFDIFLTFVLILVFTQLYSHPIQSLTSTLFVKACMLPISEFGKGASTIMQVISSSARVNNQFRQVVRGIIFTIPVLAVLLWLLASADLVMRQLLENISSFQFDNSVSFHIAVFFIATISITGILGFAFHQNRDGEQIPEFNLLSNLSSKISNLGNVELSILLGSVVALFFTFIIIQAAYLFGGATNVTHNGFTYADYARRGFFELICVAVISIIILRFTWLRKSSYNFMRICQLVLAIEVLAILASALKRLLLYEDAYGFTLSRFYAHAIILALGAMMLWLFYYLAAKRSHPQLPLAIVIITTSTLAGINLVNPDSYITQQNLDRYHQTGKLDTEYLARLSTDATPVLLNAYDHADKSLKKALGDILEQQLQYTGNYPAEWQSFNLSKFDATSALNNKAKDLSQYQTDRLSPLTHN